MKHAVVKCLCAVAVFASLAGIAGCGADDAANGGAGSGAGSDAGSSGGGVIETGVTTEAVQTCEEQCDTQEAVASCNTVLTVDKCKTVCTSLSDVTPSDCSAEFKAFYDCSVADGFKCVLGVVAQKTSACSDEQDVLDTCRNGGQPADCDGEVSGRCPSVSCECSSGTLHVSGFETKADGCVCYDTTTCKDFFCD